MTERPPVLMPKLESFKPQLKKGRITPQKGRILFETEQPFDQVILPIDLADFLVQCNGERTVGEIIENIYHQKGVVQFRLIFKALQYLGERGFLENGHELELPDTNFSEQVDFHSIKPSWSFPIGRRIFNDQQHPSLFYGLAMLIILTSIFSLQNLNWSWAQMEFFRIDGSYFFGLVFFSVTASFLLSFKNIFKTLLQVFLTGRAYNFGLSFNGYAVHFNVTSDALFLIESKLYLALFHLACFASPLPIAGALAFMWPDFPLLPELFQIVAFVMLLEANPFEDNDFNQFFKAAFPDDTFRRIATLVRQKPFISVLETSGKDQNSGLASAFHHYSLLWMAAFTGVFFYGAKFHFVPAIDIIKNASLSERLSALVLLTLIGAWFLVSASNQLKLLWKAFFTPIRGMVLGYFKRRKMQNIDYFNQDQIYKLLESLPLFSYFPKELLNMIVQKSTVQKVPKGTPVILQGDDGRELFILLNGRLEVRKRFSKARFQTLTEIHPPSIFGEIAILEDCKRMAEVTAADNSVILCIPARTLRQAAEENQYIRELEAFTNAIMVNQFFNSAPMFRDLSDSLIHLFMARGKIESFEKGEYVFNQGDPGDSFFLILRGLASVTVNGRPVAKIQQGGFFGEIALIADIPRTGAIAAAEPLTLLKIGRESFWEILSQDLQMAVFIENVGEHRIREDIEILRGKDAKIA